MKKRVGIICIIIIMLLLALFIVSKSFALDNNVEDIKYYNSLIENKKVATILLNEKTVSRKATKQEVMEHDPKIESIKDSNGNELSNTDLVKTGDYITVENEDYLVVLYGDVNKDGSICDIEDIIIIKNSISEDTTVDDIEKLAANLVNDDILDTLDIERMIQIYLGILEPDSNLITQIPEGYIDFENREEEEQPGDPEEELGTTPVEIHGKLSVEGTNIVDKNGDNFQLKGVSTHGLQYYPQFVNEDAFTYIRDEWGVNAVRLAMYSDPVNSKYKRELWDGNDNIVDNGVKYATNAGMYVIIDWHVLTEGNPNKYIDEAKLFFTDKATKYKDYDNVIYEICNEPNGNDVEWGKDIKPYAQEMIKLIRDIDDDAIIVVGTPRWSQDVDIVAQNPITGYSNIMYTLHFYAATHKEYLRKKLQTALDAGLPIFVTEFGITSASGDYDMNEEEGNIWIDLLNENNISFMCWNLANKAESSSLIKNSCSKLTGWTEDELSDHGKWYFTKALKR